MEENAEYFCDLGTREVFKQNFIIIKHKRKTFKQNKGSDQ